MAATVSPAPLYHQPIVTWASELPGPVSHGKSRRCSMGPGAVSGRLGRLPPVEVIARTSRYGLRFAEGHHAAARLVPQRVTPSDEPIGNAQYSERPHIR